MVWYVDHGSTDVVWFDRLNLPDVPSCTVAIFTLSGIVSDAVFSYLITSFSHKSSRSKKSVGDFASIFQLNFKIFPNKNWKMPPKCHPGAGK